MENQFLITLGISARKSSEAKVEGETKTGLLRPNPEIDAGIVFTTAAVVFNEGRSIIPC
jgi:hypothetical protein